MSFNLKIVSQPRNSGRSSKAQLIQKSEQPVFLFIDLNKLFKYLLQRRGLFNKFNIYEIVINN